MTTSTIPSKSLTFKVQQNEYTINYPNNGQFIEIEIMKQALARDSYGALSGGETFGQLNARFTIDMIAVFSILCPQIKKDLQVESFSALEALDNKKLLKVYVDTVLPWLNEWEQVLNSIEEETTKS